MTMPSESFLNRFHTCYIRFTSYVQSVVRNLGLHANSQMQVHTCNTQKVKLEEFVIV